MELTFMEVIKKLNDKRNRTKLYTTTELNKQNISIGFSIGFLAVFEDKKVNHDLALWITDYMDKWFVVPNEN